MLELHCKLLKILKFFWNTFSNLDSITMHACCYYYYYYYYYYTPPLSLGLQ